MTMEADRMQNLVLDPKEVDTERLVVLEERRQRTDNNPGSILREHVNAALFLNYPYRRPIIGWEHEIRGLSVDDLRDFYRRWYTPANAILVVAGDITAAELRPMAEKTYGKIPPSPTIERIRPSEPRQSASRRVASRQAAARFQRYKGNAVMGASYPWARRGRQAARTGSRPGIGPCCGFGCQIARLGLF